jgi:hypothetical protein
MCCAQFKQRDRISVWQIGSEPTHRIDEFSVATGVKALPEVSQAYLPGNFCSFHCWSMHQVLVGEAATT